RSTSIVPRESEARSRLGVRASYIKGAHMVSDAPRLNVMAVSILIGSAVLGVLGLAATRSPIPLVAMVSVGLVLMQSPRIAQQWERGVVLRLGCFVGLR